MPLLPDLTRRRQQPEVMDQPGLDAASHRAALRALARLNVVGRGAGLLWPPLAALAREMLPRPPRVLDVATGGGDVVVRLARRARRAGLGITFDGCDRSDVALDHAARHAQARGIDIRFFRADALDGPLPPGYDVVMCSLFLHHLDEEQALKFLRGLREAAGRMVLVSDLERGGLSLALVRIATRLLTRSPVVRTDGPRSVEGAFTLAEARALAERAGLFGASVARRFPCRYLLTWRRP